MKVKVKVIIEESIEIEIPNYVKKNNDAIEEYLVDNYRGFDCIDEGETSFNFEPIKII